MKLTRLIPAIAAVAALSLALKPAAAAPGPTLPVLGGPSSIVVGGFFPMDNDAKHAGGAAEINVDFRYGLPVPNLITPTRTVISLGVETGAHSGKHSTVIPLTISQIVSLTGGSPFSPGAFYVGAGVGGYVLNQSGLSSATRVGGLVTAGYNFTDAIYLDAKYQFVKHADGATVGVGLRF